MQKLFVTILLIALTTEDSYGYSFSSGPCPNIDPIPGFNLNRMLGKWYVVQRSVESFGCHHYTFMKIPYGPYQLTESKPHSKSPSMLYHEHQVKGTISVTDPYLPGRLNVDFPSNVGPIQLTVFMTNYNEYATIMECQNVRNGHNWQASILSRTPTMTRSQLDEVRRRLPSYSVDPFALNDVSQANCRQANQQTE